MSKLLEKMLNKKIDYQNKVKLKDDGKGNIYIAQWNLADPQPTQQEINDANLLYENDIRKEREIADLNARHYKICIDQIFENYKQNDSVYKNELKAIEEN